MKCIEIKSFEHRGTGDIYKLSRDPGNEGKYKKIHAKESAVVMSYITFEQAMANPMLEIRSVKLLINGEANKLQQGGNDVQR